MRRRNAKSTIEHEKRYPTGHRKGYNGFLSEMAQLRDNQLEAWKISREARSFSINDFLAAYGSHPPQEFSQAYDIPQDEVPKLDKVQRKYLVRFKNIRRSWVRLLRYAPELMSGHNKYECVELSTAHGATLEILRHFGHQVVGTDYTNEAVGGANKGGTTDRSVNEILLDDSADDRTWPYQPIIDSLGLDVRLFDAGVLPYPFEDDRFDYLMCFDALEHYCHPKDWMTIIEEFTRITRRAILIELNPVRRERVGVDHEYMACYQQFYDDILNCNINGFQCVATAEGFNQPRFFKLMKLG